MFSFTTQKSNYNFLIEIVGEMNDSDILDIKLELNKVYTDNDIKNIIIDLNKVTILLSNGIGFIVGVYKRCIESDKTLYLVNQNDFINKTLIISGIPKIINKVDTIANINKKVR